MSLARQGHFQAHEDERRRRAGLVALLLTAQTGTVWTEDQIMGTEAEAQASREATAEQHLEALQERMKNAAPAHYEVVGTHGD